MKRESIFLTMSDGEKISRKSWIPESEINAVVVISHGMAEFIGRYENFAKNLCEAGFAVFGHDHRGHGDTAGSIEKLGFLAEHDGFQRVVLDVKESIQNIKESYPSKKIFIFGHSFGSFVAQSFIEQFGHEIDGCVLCGTAGPRIPLVKMAKFLSILFGAKRNPHRRSVLLNDIAFGSYNAKIKNNLTDFDWLSRDASEVTKYIENDYCGFLPTVSFFYDMFSGLYAIHKNSALKSIPKELPIFLIAGSADPVGDYGKTVSNLFHIYQRNGMVNVSLKFFTGARHELLNETNKAEVISDVITWLNNEMA